MKRLAPWTLLLVPLLVVIVPFALAAATAQPAGATRGDRYPGAPVASAISTITGIAISPLLGTGAYGLYHWLKAENEAARAKLPWYAQPEFWLPALLVVAACAAKDAFGATVPTGLKKPLDVLEAIENKFSGLIAAGAVVPFALDAMAKLLFEPEPGPIAAAAGATLEAGGFAAVQLGAADVTWLVNALTVPFGIAVFLLVWLASHAINVLILLSPWGLIDGALKAARTSLLGLVTIAATIDPWLGAALSLVVIVVAYCVSGWAFRLMIFGAMLCWEIATRRSRRFRPAENDNKMFAGAVLTAEQGVPVRSYGRLVQRTEGRLEFVYRPWLIGRPRVARVEPGKQALAVGEGIFFSDIVDEDDRTVFALPPRYRGHEATLARAYLLGGGVRPAGLRKAWSELRDMIGGRAVKKEPLAA